MDKLFKEFSQYISVYPSQITVADPYEKNVTLSYLNPLPIKAIVTDLIASQINWKIPGIVTNKAKEIFVEKKYRSLIEFSYKIKINNEYYVCWKVNNNMQIREEQDYLRIYCYIEKS